MFKESSVLSFITLLIFLCAATLIFLITKETAREKYFNNRLTLLENQISEFYKSQYTNEDHETFVKQRLSKDDMILNKLTRIFARLRNIEHQLNIEPPESKENAR